MESINLDLDDLMEPVDELEDDYDLPVVSALPAFDDDNDENLLDTSVQHNDGLLDTLLDPGGGEEGDAPAKKIVNRKPIPKLDATRLTGERGLPALLKHFEKVKYKGKGHEVSDLDLLMRTLEHWAHRLFPKMPFDDVIERIEKLGGKKPVQTCLKRIRLDMPLMDEDFVTRGEDDATADNDIQIIGADVDDVFPTQPVSATQPPSAHNINTPKVTMSDEQRERIERNKRLAMEKKLAKQKQDVASSQRKDSDLDDHITMETSGKSSYAGNQDGIDSEEEEIEREMWNQMMGGSKKEENKKKEEQEGEKKKEEKKDGQVSGKAKEDVCEIDSDDAEMENEIWNQMTEPIPSQPKKASQEEDVSQVPSRKKRRVILDDDDEDKDDDDIVVCEKMEASNDICNEMTEPVLSQTQKESKQKEMQVDPEVTSPGKKRVVGKDVDPVDEETGHEIWNQMTEPIPTQSADASQRKVQNSKSAVSSTTIHDSSDDDDDAAAKKQGEPKTGVDICNEMTEPVDIGTPAKAVSSQANGHAPLGKDVMQSMETFVEQDDADLDDSTMWTQITSTNPGENVPSTNPEDNLPATATSQISGRSQLGQDVMQSMETFVEQDDADLDDSSMWTQMTSSNPGDEVPSTNPEDNLPSSLGNADEVPKGTDGKVTDKNDFDDDIEAEESQSIFMATARSKKRKMIISDDEDED